MAEPKPQEKKQNKKPPPVVTPQPQTTQIAETPAPTAVLPLLVQRAIDNPDALNPNEINHLQRTLGNRAIGQLTTNETSQTPVPSVQAMLSSQRAMANNVVQTKPGPNVIQRRGGDTSAAANTHEIAQVLAKNPHLSIEEACRLVAERQQPAQEEEGGFWDAVEDTFDTVTSAIGDFFSDMWNWASNNPEEIVLGVALLNPVSAGPVLLGLGWSQAMPIIVDHIHEGWVKHVLPLLTFEQMAQILDHLEESYIFTYVNLLTSTGLLAPFILAMGWDIRILNKISLFIPRLILQELAQMDRIGFANWVGAKIDAIWPVGVGYIITGQIGATFGYPIYLGAEGKEDVYRFQAEQYQLTKVGRLTVAGDTESGAGGFINLGPIQAKLEAKAEAQAGLKMMGKEVFKFPTAQDDALLPFLLEVAPLELSSMGQIVQPLINIIPGLSADKYRQEFTVEMLGFGAAGANATAGLTFGGEGADPQATTQKAATEGDAQGTWWQSLLPTAFARAGLNLEGGMALSLYPQPEDDSRMRFKVTAKMGGKLDAGAGATILKIIKKRFSLINIDVEGSVSLTGEIVRGAEDINWTNFEVEGQSGVPNELSPIGTPGTKVTGDYSLDKPEVSGTEPTSVLEHLYDLIPDSLTIQKRLTAGKGFGKGWLLQNRDFLNTIMPQKDYREYGAIVQGLMSFSFRLSKAQLMAIADWVSDFVTDEGDARAQAVAVWADIKNFFQTGAIPSWLTNAAQIGAFLKAAGLQEARARFTIGFAMAAGAHAGEGAKVQLHGGVTASRYHEYDLFNYVGNQQILDYIITNLQAFLSDKSDDAPLNVTSYLDGPGTDDPVQ